ncbi:MAG: ABC transporter substrate-binding protein [SAR202 cluster bacterium]|nr:ABC transporter substrate-binding protein [SAR202 cluster bacterium]
MIKSRMGSARHLGGIYLFKISKIKFTVGLLLMVAMTAVIACGGTETVEVVKEVEVIKEVEVKGDTVVETVVVTEKGDTVTVEKEVLVVATATAQPAAPEAAPEELIKAPSTSTPAGMAVIATGGSTLGSENGRGANQSCDCLKNIGIGETLFRRAPDDTHLPWLASDFTIASDLSSATVTIQSGVPFQVVDGYDAGDMTAHDVAWSMNDANNATNAESIHGQAGDFAGLWGEWTAVDDTTIKFDFAAYDSTWKDDYVNQSGQAFNVFSKKAFDEKGADWVADRIVATGPYQVEEWVTGESYTVVNREGTHWLPELEPKTERIQFVQVAEPTTRLALLRTGEVDMAHLEPKDAAKLDLTTFTQSTAGGAVQLGVFFSGNLWEDTLAKTGEPVPPKATFVHDIPWIGKPGSSHGDGDLEQAKQIRRALAIAIDRDLVNDTLVAGLGKVVHVEYFSAEHANWTGEHEYPYDPDGAIALIKAQEKDYNTGQAGKDGPLGDHAFEISVYAGPELGGGGSITGEVADAVAGFWSDIGLTTFSLKFSYATFRPTVVGRSNTHPWITSCDKGRASNPWHFPKGLVQTTLTRGGFSCGFESPVILDLYTRMAEASDQASATEAANEYLDYVYDQNLQPGVVAIPDAFYFNNNKIKSFEQDLAAASNLNSLWKLELK